MSKLHRLFRVVRGRRLVAVALFVVLTYLFANNLDPTPRFVVRTNAKMDRTVFYVKDHEWVTVEGVSNDGEHVAIGVQFGGRGDVTTRLQWWDTRVGINRTPSHWHSAEWERLSTRSMIYGGDSGLVDLVRSASGQEFLQDAEAWARLRERLPVEDVRHKARSRDEDDRKLFEDTLRFSPDGRHVKYVVRTGWPDNCFWFEALSWATVVEDARTGRKVAVLPAVANEVAVAPGGRTAVQDLSWGHGVQERLRALMRDSDDADKGEQPRFLLRNLKSSTIRVELSMPAESFAAPEFSPDGRFIFAKSLTILRWWNTETGRIVGEISDPPNRHFLDDGRKFVVQSTDHNTLYFWDVSTGRQMADWELPQPREGTGSIGRVESSGGDRYVAVDIYPDTAGNNSNTIPLVERLLDKLPELPRSKDRGQILVLDVVERRVVGKVPGGSAAFSPDGRWLATINDEGVVRVWEMPFGRPWGRGLAYAASLVFGSCLLLALLGKVRRQLWRRRAAERNARSEGDAVQPTASPVA